MGKHIIFLDIDGVLNSNHFYDNWYNILLHKISKKYARSGTRMISKWRLLFISILCKVKSCDIVLSTSWRALWNDDMTPGKLTSAYKVDRLFKKWGLHLIGKTGRGVENPKYKPDKVEYPIRWEDQKYWRGTEILDYIDRHHLNIEDCIIIDDEVRDIECYSILKDRIVETSYYQGIGGFGFKSFITALKILK